MTIRNSLPLGVLGFLFISILGLSILASSRPSSELTAQVAILQSSVVPVLGCGAGCRIEAEQRSCSLVSGQAYKALYEDLVPDV